MTSSSLQLVDINYDCLLHIFQYLDVDTLVSIAEADHRFIEAAAAIFSRYNRQFDVMHLSPRVDLRCDLINYCQNPSNIEPFFRHFGHLISNLNVDFVLSKKVDIDFGKLLQEHCGTSLVSMNLACYRETEFQSNEKPFIALKQLKVFRGTLSKWSQINVRCPNLNRLELFEVKLNRPHSIEVNFPQLKHLQIYNKMDKIPKTNICEMLRLNPQLEELTLQCDYDIDFLELLGQNLRMLKTLEIWSPKDRFSSFGDRKIRFETVNKFALKASDDEWKPIVEMPFEFVGLQELSFNCYNVFKGPIMEFVMRCGDLIKLKLIPCLDEIDDLAVDDLKKVIKSCPQLEELTFCADNLREADIIQFLSDGKHLEKVTMLILTLLLSSTFFAKIKDEWNASFKQVELPCRGNDTTFCCFNLERKV